MKFKVKAENFDLKQKRKSCSVGGGILNINKEKNFMKNRKVYKRKKYSVSEKKAYNRGFFCWII